MIRITNKQLVALKNGEISPSKFADDLIEKYPVKEISLALTELLAKSDDVIKIQKIPITKEQFEEHFRFIGDSPRGRKKKDA